MQLCRRCGVSMMTGTHYEGNNHNRYYECPKCHERVNGKKNDNSKIGFREMLHAAAMR